MINRAEVARCNLCNKLLVCADESGPLDMGRVQDEQLLKFWMPNHETIVCNACKQKYKKGGGVVKDFRKEENCND